MASEDDLAKLSRRAMVAFAVRCARRVQPLTRSLPAERVENMDKTLSTLEGLVNQDDWSTNDGWIVGTFAVAGWLAVAVVMSAAAVCAAVWSHHSGWLVAWSVIAWLAAGWFALVAGAARTSEANAAGRSAFAARASAWAANASNAAASPDDETTAKSRTRFAADAARLANEAASSRSAKAAAANSSAAAAWSFAAASRDAKSAADADYHRLVELDLGPPGKLGRPFDPTESGPLGPLWPEGIKVPGWY